MTERLYFHNGKLMTLPEIAKEAGLNRRTLHGRIYRSGLDLEEAIKPVIAGPGSKSYRYEFRGKQKTAKEIAKAMGKSASWVRSHCRDGKFVEPIVQPRRITSDTMLSSDGKVLSIREWAKVYGQSPETIIARLERGQSVEAAIRPSEAQRIEREEFAAESAALMQRALGNAAARRAEEAEKVKAAAIAPKYLKLKSRAHV